MEWNIFVWLHDLPLAWYRVFVSIVQNYLWRFFFNSLLHLYLFYSGKVRLLGRPDDRDAGQSERDLGEAHPLCRPRRGARRESISTSLRSRRLRRRRRVPRVRVGTRRPRVMSSARGDGAVLSEAWSPKSRRRGRLFDDQGGSFRRRGGSWVFLEPCCDKLYWRGNHHCQKIRSYQTKKKSFVRTVKALNFRPHGNFGPLFQKGLLSLKRVLQKNEENKSCRKSLDPQIRFCSFFVHDSSTRATELARKSPKFPWGPKLEAITVLFACTWNRWSNCYDSDSVTWAWFLPRTYP